MSNQKDQEAPEPKQQQEQEGRHHPAAPARRGNDVVINEKGDIEAEGIERCMTFDAMGLSEELLRGVYAYGFEVPSAIQQMAVRPIISGRVRQIIVA